MTTRLTRRRLVTAAGAAGAVLSGGRLSRLVDSGAEASAAPAGQPVPGGTLRIGITGGWATLDPPHYTNVSERQIFYSIYNPLFSLTPAFAIGPALVKTWTVSPDGLRLTFRLQPGARFQDGTPCDAAAVKFNIERTLDPATGSASGCTAAWMVRYGIAKPEQTVHILQGVEIKRPSHIFVRAGKEGDTVKNVRVGGHAVQIMEATYSL